MNLRRKTFGKASEIEKLSSANKIGWIVKDREGQVIVESEDWETGSIIFLTLNIS